MKRILTCLFPILGEDIPVIWMDEESVENRMATACMRIGVFIGIALMAIALSLFKLLTT